MADAESAASPAAFEAFERLIRRVNFVRHSTSGTAVVVGLIFAIMLLSDDSFHFISVSAAGWLIVVAGMVIFAVAASWPVIWSVGSSKLFRATLYADGMRPFHDLREAMASGRIIALRPDGGIHSAPLFASPWALTAFSRHEDVRHMRLPGSRAGVADEPLIAEIDEQEQTAIDEEPSELVTSLSQVADRLASIEKAVAETAALKTRPSPTRKVHWYANVTEVTHKEKLSDIANRWSGLHYEQATYAFNKAFELTREGKHPCILAKDLASMVAESLKAAGFTVGLGDSDSTVWLEKSLGGGDKNDYAFVRRYLTEPGYKLPYELPLSGEVRNTVTPDQA